jgi:hypothetical protein
LSLISDSNSPQIKSGLKRIIFEFRSWQKQSQAAELLLKNAKGQWKSFVLDCVGLVLNVCLPIN